MLPTNLGREIRQLADTLPLVPARQDASGGPVTANLKKLELQLRGLDLAARGDGHSAGTIDLDLPIQQFHADAHVSSVTVVAGCIVKDPFDGHCVQSVNADIVQLCGAFDVGVSNVSTGLRIRIEGPPTAVSRAGSARNGMPILGGPSGFGVVTGGLNVNLGSLDTCMNELEAGTILIGGSPLSVIGSRKALGDAIKSVIASKISDRLSHPEGDLRANLNLLGNNMNPVLTGPLLESILFVPSRFPILNVDARNAVVVDVDGSGQIRAVFEKDLLSP